VVDANPLSDAVNHTTRAWIVRIKTYTQTKVISEELDSQNLERSAHIIKGLRKQGWNDLIKKRFDSVISAVIVAYADDMLSRTLPPPPSSLEDVIAIDREARVRAREAMEPVR